MNATPQDWNYLEVGTNFRARVQTAKEKHKSTPEITPQSYLAQRRAELVRQLDGQKLIYLDTNHWINLRHIVVQSPERNAVYDTMLGLLESLRQNGRICCPVSATLFCELMKQDDRLTRQATARIMDFLSGGVCLQNWLDLARAEFGRHVCRMLYVHAMDGATFSTWTKVGYWAGEHTFKFPVESEEDSMLLEKVYIDLRWDMTCNDYQSMPGWTPTPDNFAIAWIADIEQAKAHQLQNKFSIQKLARARRIQLLQASKDTLLPMLAFCQGAPGTADDHVTAVLDPIYKGRDPLALPSLEVVAGLDAAVTLDTKRKVDPNDREDYLHAAQALPYCDALFCEKFMAQKLRDKPLEFGKTYETLIGSHPEEIVDYLKSL